MNRLYVDRPTLVDFLGRLHVAADRSGRLYLVGETSQVYEGWQSWTGQVTLTIVAQPADKMALAATVQQLQTLMALPLLDEGPGDVMPLPAGHATRARRLDGFSNGLLQLYHFDPYSVAFRLLARGDEPDYRVILTYLKHGWLVVEEMNRLLADLLPQFTSRTIQQDPAEFRRKYKGLLQMWRASQ